MNIQKRLSCIVLLLILCISLCNSATVMPGGDIKVIDTCGKGALLEISGQKVLLLQGSSYEMGYQQGKLLKPQVRKLVETILTVTRIAEASKAKGYFNGSIEQAFERTKGFIDQRFHQEMQGLADGAELPLEKIQIANIFPELFHCSGFAMFGSATKDGILLHGRILDYMTQIGLQDMAVVTVARPLNYNSFVTIGYAGFIGSVTGMNDKQITIGEMGGKGEGQWDGMPMSFLLRKALEEAATLDEAVKIFQQTPRTCEYYYVISDAKIPDARGLACTPDKFELVFPGKIHELLPNPVKDCVLLSAGDRYTHLSNRTNDQKGNIDVDIALDLMNRPIAMESCLHRVLFEPAGLNFWVANAVSILDDPNYAACYQPYYKYNMNELAAFFPKDAQDTSLVGTNDSDTKTAPLQIEQPQVTKGLVAKTIVRDIPKALDAQQHELLQAYLVEPQEFAYEMKPLRQTDTYQLYEVTFPSPYTSEVAQNNTIYCEYYRAMGQAKRPAVILLDILDGSMIVSRLIASKLVSSGIDACIMTLPHYGSRKSSDLENQLRLTDDINLFVNGIRQAVMDVRQSARWLMSLEHVDSNNIGICGTSLGGFIAALSSGVDGNFSKTVILLAGGDLSKVLTTDQKEVSAIKAHLDASQISSEELETKIAIIEPLNFANRINSSSLLMINGSTDKIVPPACAQKLADKSGTQINWYQTDHYGMANYIFIVMDSVQKHFSN